MRSDMLPLCDKDYATMEVRIAPLSADSCVEFCHCQNKWCSRCYSEVLGYVTPVKGERPTDIFDKERCSEHGCPMFISAIDRKRSLARLSCPQPNCSQGVMKRLG